MRSRHTPSVLRDFVARWRVTARALVLSGLAGCAPTGPAPARAPTTAPTHLLRMERGDVRAELIAADFTLFDVPIADVTSRACPATATRGSVIETQIRAAALIRAVRRVGGTARTVLAADDVTPSTTETDMQDGDRIRSYRVSYGENSFSYEYQRTGDTETKRGEESLDVPAAIHDLHSAFRLLRAWKPRLGEEAQFFVVMGRHLWRVDARSAGRTVILIHGAPRVTTRIDGEALRVDAPEPAEPGKSRRSFSIWVEEGSHAVPVRLTAITNYGEVTMTLSRYESSPEGCEPALPAR